MQWHDCSTSGKFYVRKSGKNHAFITASIQYPMSPEEAARYSYARIGHILKTEGLNIVHERIFASRAVSSEILRARSNILLGLGISSINPVTYIEGHPSWGKGMAGVLVHAVLAPCSPNDMWTIMDRGFPCGKAWKQGTSTCLVLQDIHPMKDDLRRDTSGAIHARLMIERGGRILRENGASYRDVARTWLYLAGILDWYPDFNKVRNEKYKEFGLIHEASDTPQFLPASTGIGGESLSDTACTMDLIAVVGNNIEHLYVERMQNPSQSDAFLYGSAFSRGAIIKTPESGIIEISGTASVDEHGLSLYPGNIRAQIECTFDKLEALLGQEDIGLRDVCSATVFVKRPEYAEVFYEMASKRGLDDFPCVCIVADICREELLFEIDGEAFTF